MCFGDCVHILYLIITFRNNTWINILIAVDYLIHKVVIDVAAAHSLYTAAQ